MVKRDIRLVVLTKYRFDVSVKIIQFRTHTGVRFSATRSIHKGNCNRRGELLILLEWHQTDAGIVDHFIFFCLLKRKLYSIKIVTLPTLCKENTLHDIN